ncbi:M48 family metallopeptidase [Thermococcus sp.]
MKVEVRWRPVRYARLEIKPDGRVVVTAPKGFDVEAFLRKHRRWLWNRLAELEEVRRESSRGFPLFGEFYGVKLENGGEVEIRGKTLILPVKREKARESLKALLKERLMPLIALYSTLLGVSPGRIYIRNQRKKWASCSSRGNLSFNLRLVALPESLIQYIVIHELAHLRYLDHSPEFWSLVKRFYPDYRNARKELRRWWGIIEVNEKWLWLEGRE